MKRPYKIRAYWLVWEVDENGDGFVRLKRWKVVCYETAIKHKSHVNVATAWWMAEERARNWARKQKVFLLKERL